MSRQVGILSKQGHEREFPVDVKNQTSLNLPVRWHEGSAGLDLISSKNYILQPHSFKTIPTEVQVAIPPDHFGLIAPRSNLGSKGIIPMAGIIDANFSGTISVVMFNHSEQEFEISTKNGFAQLIIAKLCNSTPILLSPKRFANHHSHSQRGSLGFGSTDVN